MRINNGMTMKCPGFIAFSPQAVKSIYCKAGLLTYPSFEAFPFFQEQWRSFKSIKALRPGLTAAGTVADFHGIPF